MGQIWNVADPTHGSNRRFAANGGIGEPSQPRGEEASGTAASWPAEAPPTIVPARAGGAHAREYRSRGARSTGLTSRGVILLLGVATTLAGLVGSILFGHRNALFGITFAVVAALCALSVRRRDLAVAVIAPPIVYCVAIVVVSLVDARHLAGGFFSRETFYVADAFVTGAPAMWVGTGLAALLAALRRLSGPSGRRR
ncbi:MAG: hypothetical protein K6T28_09965 [Acidothermus sp.]|nr:hypothetical protein [Acidothermus sp.]